MALPPGVVTTTVHTPVAPAGTMTTREVPVFDCTLAANSQTVTVAPVRFVPVIVSEVPVVPDVGLIPVTVGAGGVTGIAAASPRMLSPTMPTMSAPRTHGHRLGFFGGVGAAGRLIVPSQTRSSGHEHDASSTSSAQAIRLPGAPRRRLEATWGTGNRSEAGAGRLARPAPRAGAPVLRHRTRRAHETVGPVSGKFRIGVPTWGRRLGSREPIAPRRIGATNRPGCRWLLARETSVSC